MGWQTFVTIQRGQSGGIPLRDAFGGIAKPDEHNECRALGLQRLYNFSPLGYGWTLAYIPSRFEAEQGTPVCFVNASDPRVQNFTEEASERFKTEICAKVQLLPCGVHRCKVRIMNEFDITCIETRG